MLLNYSAPRIAPNIVAAPTSNLDINSILGLTPSRYSGLQSVGDTGYYYGDNKMYEAYTPSPVRYYQNSPFGIQYFSGGSGPLAQQAPSYHPIFGYSGGWQKSGGAAAGTISRGNQSFRPLDVDVTGFTKTKPEGSNIYEYAPSMAYVYSQMRPQVAAQPNVMALNVPGYQRANQMLSSPMATGAGAGRFLNTGNLLGFNFTPEQTATSPGQSPAI
jgi:hypothetical protein